MQRKYPYSYCYGYIYNSVTDIHNSRQFIYIHNCIIYRQFNYAYPYSIMHCYICIMDSHYYIIIKIISYSIMPFYTRNWTKDIHNAIMDVHN